MLIGSNHHLLDVQSQELPVFNLSFHYDFSVTLPKACRPQTENTGFMLLYAKDVKQL